MNAWLSSLALVLAAACSSGSGGGPPATDATFPAAAYTSATSDSGKLRVEVRTAPTQPPPRGTCTIELTVTDAAGAPKDGLDVSVVPWMDAMGHGASVKASVTAKGGGKYVVGNVSMFMPGTWTLRTTFSGPVDDHAAPLVDVP